MKGPIVIDVIGLPKPQGSKRAIVVKGKARLIESSGDSFARWRNDVTTAVADRCAEMGIEPLDEPLSLDATFFLPMPKARPKAARTAGVAWKTVQPDLDKLARSVGDAMQAAGLVADDSLFVLMTLRKVEAHNRPTGARLIVNALDEPSSAAPELMPLYRAELHSGPRLEWCHVCERYASPGHEHVARKATAT